MRDNLGEREFLCPSASLRPAQGRWVQRPELGEAFHSLPWAPGTLAGSSGPECSLFIRLKTHTAARACLSHGELKVVQLLKKGHGRLG